ncbi:MAG: Tfp pilus assembly protein PilX [Phycisphaerales bacterium]|jgi:Tfp pilus assembly protein PilX
MNNEHTQSNTVDRRGIALMLVMIAVLVVGGMSVAYFGSRDNSIAISKNVSSASRARIAAESGLDLAIAILESNADWRNNHVNGVILSDYPLAGSNITITVLDNETSLPPTASTLEVDITIASTVDGKTQITQATATITPNEDEFDVDYSEYAVFAQNHISISDAASIQNWSASPSYSNAPLQVGTLSTQPMAVQFNTIRSTSNVELHAYEYASSMLSTSAVLREQFKDELPFYDPPAPPSSGQKLSLDNRTSNINQRSSSRFNSATVMDAGTYSVEALSLQQSNTIIIKGEVTLHVEDNLSLQNATIILSEEASLTLHVGGRVNITSSYIGNENKSINSWMDPSRVTIYGHGSNTWKITGTSILKAELYAPDCEIQLRGASTICGRIAGEEVQVNGTARVLYDQSLDHGGFAEAEGMLYNEHGKVRDELRQISQLNPELLQNIADALYALDSPACAFGNPSFDNDWQDRPTERPHAVYYEILSHGADPRTWEQLARVARTEQTGGSNTNSDPRNDTQNVQYNHMFDWNDLDLEDMHGSLYNDDSMEVDQ